MKKDQMVVLRAGLFVFVMLIAITIVIFVLGKEKGYFKRQFTLYTSFPDVHGLLPGAPVRLAGVTVGKVADVTIPELLEETRLLVTLQIEERVQSRIRKDSVALIKWLSYVTGDSYIELSMGSREEKIVKEGDFIQGVIPTDYSRAFESGVALIDDIHNNLKKVEKEKIIESLSDSVESLADIVGEIKNGDGLIHRLIFDEEGAVLFDNLSQSSENVRRVTDDIVNGNGVLNAMIYNREDNGIMKTITGLSNEVEKIANQITNGNGLLHAILYDEDKRMILDNLVQVTENLQAVTKTVNDGDGSLGAMINDPALYDSVNQLMGGANRSFILRTLIRHSLKRD
ncbi:MAG: MlaD family protein [Candidatus Scalindua sp.]|nr:MlaD family protein [Candidatus Scalindua sp.]